VKRYVVESGSAVVRRWLGAGFVATSRLSEVEIASAVARRTREGVFSTRERDRVLRALALDMASIHVVELLPPISAKARGLLLRHPLRASDAIQLASCVFLQQELGEAIPLVAFDERLRTAAHAEGLTVDPV
jgi:uncharacterized protein